MRKIRLVLGLPCYGGKVTMFQSRMWLSLGHALASHDDKFVLRDFPLVDVCGVDVARNEVMTAAFKSAANAKDEEEKTIYPTDPFNGYGAWLLMIDADTWHDNNLQGGYDLLQMVRTGEKLGAAAIGAPVPRRAPGETRYMVYSGKTEGTEGRQGKRDEHGGFLRAMPYEDWAGKVVECDSIATAIFAVNLRFALMMQVPWFLYSIAEGTMDRLGEDIYFCRKARALGGKIYVDGRFVGNHLQRPIVEEPKQPMLVGTEIAK
jgi:hypothetical protein